MNMVKPNKSIEKQTNISVIDKPFIKIEPIINTECQTSSKPLEKINVSPIMNS